MNLRNLDAPDALTYLNEVEGYLKDDVASFNVFLQAVNKLLKGNRWDNARALIRPF